MYHEGTGISKRVWIFLYLFVSIVIDYHKCGRQTTKKSLTFYFICNATGNQCISFRIGVTLKDLLEFVISLAVQFWTLCLREIVVKFIPVKNCQLLAISVIDVNMAFTKVIAEQFGYTIDLIDLSKNTAVLYLFIRTYPSIAYNLKIVPRFCTSV